MKSASQERFFFSWWQLVLLALLLIPVIVMLLVPARGSIAWLAVWFVLLLVFNLVIIWLIVRDRATPAAPPRLEPQQLSDQDVPPPVHDVMNVNMALNDGNVLIFRGNLREPAEAAYERLKMALAPNWAPLIQQDPEQQAAVVLMPKSLEERSVARPIRPWVHWLLFALTFLTTTWAGALHQGVNVLRQPDMFYLGLPYSIGLLAILGFHEMGHYLTAKHYGMRVTPPYFIPVPFALGTFGAFIAMRSPAESRTTLFDVAVAGPLAGLVLAIPALIIGLHHSVIIPPGPEAQEMALGGGAIGSSVLFGLVAKATLGKEIASGSVLQLSPLAFAGWLGLLVTALNLVPIGQLDGGHIVRAMFGTRGGMLISRIAMWALVILAIFVWPSLLFWAFIVFFIARSAVPPQNDITPITKGRLWLGAFSFLILVLILTPMPRAFWGAVSLIG